MIQANECRIGNCLHDRHGNVIRIQNGFFYIVQDPKRLDDYSPIQLTPEILEKCGFWKGNFAGLVNGDFIWSLGVLSIREGAYFISCQYLHQIQNIFFALTGTELEVNI
jgi:hypothetical protein